METPKAFASKMMLLTVGIRSPFRYLEMAAVVTPDNADNSAPFTLLCFIQKDRRSGNFLTSSIGNAGKRGFDPG